MLVSTKGRYALRMMIDIARQPGGERVSLREIGHRQGISPKYLEQLARMLCNAGLLLGSRGQGGGYVLAKPALQISAGDILRATEGTVAPVACLASTDVMCPRSYACETNSFWEGLDQAIEAYVDKFTLEDLVDMQNNDEIVPGPCLSFTTAPTSARGADQTTGTESVSA